MNAKLELESLRTRSFGRSLRHERRVDSTNRRLLEWAREGAPHGAVLWADAQSAGRGRQGRNWLSGEGDGLYASLLLCPPAPVGRWAAFSLVAALALAEVLREGWDLPVGVKWPNDLWLDGRKLAGILLEAQGGDEPRLVVGIGVNLRPPAGGWPDELRGRALSLAEAGAASVSAPELLAALLERLEVHWDRFVQEGFAVFLEAWRRFDRLTGRTVTVEQDAQRQVLRVEGVDREGRLVAVDERGRRRTLNAGEVHLSSPESTT